MCKEALLRKCSILCNKSSASRSEDIMKSKDYVNQALVHWRFILASVRTSDDLFDTMKGFEDEIVSLFEQGLIKKRDAHKAIHVFANDCVNAPVE